MKKFLMGGCLSMALVLGACQSLSFTQSSYDPLVGEWTVDQAVRPAGWQDTTYSFTADREFRISYDTAAPYGGTVLGVDKASILVEGTADASKSPQKMTMCYTLDAAGTTMQLGWYDGFLPKYYLTLSRQ